MRLPRFLIFAKKSAFERIRFNPHSEHSRGSNNLLIDGFFHPGHQPALICEDQRKKNLLTHSR